MKAIVKLFMVLFFVSVACSSGTSLATRDESTDYAAGNEPPGFSGACNTDDPAISGTKGIFIPVSGERYAFREYNVTPFDTIWFDDYLVVGRDTTYYDQIFPSGLDFAVAVGYYYPEPFFWSARLRRFHYDLYLPFYPTYTSFGQLLEYYKQLAEESRIYNYQYYMPHPPVFAASGSKPDDPDRNRRGFIRLSLLSAALVVLSVLP